MSLLRSLRRGDPRRAAGIAYRLHCLRFLQALENALSLADLHADGTEKAKGDYILDRHYAEALVDEALELAGGIVFDACVLVPDGGGDLLGHLDDHAQRARGILREFEEGSTPDRMKDLDPEYGLLSRVLEWVGGPGSRSEKTLRALVRQALRHGIVGSRDRMPALPRAPALRFETPAVINEVRWVNTAMKERQPTEGDEDSLREEGQFLRMMVKEVSRGGRGERGSQEREEREWIAAVRDGRLTLWRADGPSHVRVEASLGGTPASDLLFLYGSGDTDLGPVLGERFDVEWIGPDILAWLKKPVAESIEPSLSHLGRLLFGTSGGTYAER